MTAQYITRETVRRDRQTWIDFLMQPERKKAIGRLSIGGENRCCLGHACQVLLGDPGDKWDITMRDGKIIVDPKAGMLLLSCEFKGDGPSDMSGNTYLHEGYQGIFFPHSILDYELRKTNAS